MDTLNAEVRRTRGNLRRALQSSAITSEQWARLTRERFLAERALSEKTGRRVLHLACGHDRAIDIQTYEELDMERTGTVQCRATKTPVWYPRHRFEFQGVLGWVDEGLTG